MLDTRTTQVFLYISDFPGCTTKAIVSDLGIPLGSVQRALWNLQQSKAIVTVKTRVPSTILRYGVQGYTTVARYYDADDYAAHALEQEAPGVGT